MTNKKTDDRVEIILRIALFIAIVLIAIGFILIDGLDKVQDSIQNKTLEPNQTLAYELGYSNGYYQCVEEVQQLQEEGKL